MGQHPAERAKSCIGKRVGCAAPPNLTDWEDFVQTLVKRYKGQISNYELWNEPNGSGFWTGSPPQMVELAARAYPIINQLILQPSLLLRQHRPPAGPFPTMRGWINIFLRAAASTPMSLRGTATQAAMIVPPFLLRAWRCRSRASEQCLRAMALVNFRSGTPRVDGEKTLSCLTKINKLRSWSSGI